jgi:hypothetical protein
MAAIRSTVVLRSRAVPVALLAGIVATASVAGCGGGSSDTAEQGAPAVSLTPLVRCLRQSVRHGRVTTAQSDLDQIARRATGGAARVRFGVSSFTPKGVNVATIAIEHTTKEAKATEARYRAVYKSLGGNPAGLLSRTANAVVAFGARPSAADRSVVTGCVRPTR